MVFSSVFFLFFFLPCAILANFLSMKWIKIQNFILMLFSLLFYYWGEKNYIVVMLGCILINYISGLLIHFSVNQLAKKIYLMMAIVVSIGLLGYFKYCNFIMDNINYFLDSKIDEGFTNIILPLGISFYTFHALSYVIDVYWGKVPAEKNIFTFICYVSLFPQLVAGPIVRYKDIRHSLYHRVITRTGFKNGILRFCFGMGKKILIANTLAVVADKAFALPHADLTFATAWLGAIAYTLQIYFDFSGYSDMAIGIGLMLGFRYKENFNFPYRALSIQDFWRRWHISLSSWFRDYLYIPLGGSRKGESRTYLNLIIVFALCGLWHGANYTFLAWGLFHGLFLVLERTKFGKFIHGLSPFFKHGYVLLIVLLGWVLFRAESFSDAATFFQVMFSTLSFDISALGEQMNPIVFLAFFIGIVLSLGLNSYMRDYLVEKKNKYLITLYQCFSATTAIVVLLITLLPLSSNSYNPFLYFKF